MNPLLQTLTREGVLLNVSVRYWRAHKKLRPEDIGLEPDKVSARLISLGHKRLLPREATAALALVESRAHALVEANTFPFLNGLAHFLPNAKLAGVTTQLRALEAEFAVATANDVSQLPPELLRAGRWDQMFFVDLPNVAEREAIWTIQIRKHGRNPADYDAVQLARASEGLTGSEIEAVFVESLYDAFDRDAEPTDLDIARVLTDFVPLSRTMAEPINALRTWAAGRARFATSPAAAERRLRKIAA